MIIEYYVIATEIDHKEGNLTEVLNIYMLH